MKLEKIPADIRKKTIKEAQFEIKEIIERKKQVTLTLNQAEKIRNKFE